MISCPVCNSKKIKDIIGEYAVCKVCRCLYLQEMPDDNHLKKQSESDAIYMIEPSGLTGNGSVCSDRLWSILKYTKSPANILDVGYGSGKFLQHVKDKGYTPYGIELSKKLVTFGKKLGINAYLSFGEFPRQKMDVVTLFDVIEHITTPYEFMIQVNKTLRKGGVLMITTPNANSISAKVLKSKWWVFGPEAHFVVYSLTSLKILLRGYGYKIVSTQTDTINQWFYPNNTFTKKVLNKLQYEILGVFRNQLFRNNLGDNIQIIAIKE
jgi:2-polyprenyl-3-methyl-5-hydroxy-6-metoxy-1,4-benzoquinol methylase